MTLTVITGKACSMKAQKYVDEEEEVDDVSDALNSSMGHGWLNMRRNTQIAPTDGVMLGKLIKSPVMLADLVDWKLISRKYLAIQGLAPDVSRSQGDEAGQGTHGGHMTMVSEVASRSTTASHHGQNYGHGRRASRVERSKSGIGM
jgi:hypothetical protein